MRKPLDLSFIKDSTLRDTFQQVVEEFRSQEMNKGQWKFFTFPLDRAVTNYRFKHGLGFQPKDVLQTSLTGAGSLTWNYDLFDKDFLDVTSTGPCTVRAFIGTYKENG